MIVGSSHWSVGSEAMKPASPSAGGKGRFPQTDYFFHSGFGQWHGGNFWPFDGEDRSRFKKFYNLGREYPIEAARERGKEKAVVAVIFLDSARSGVCIVVSGG